MASIFTYDPDPPRISSPWPNTPASTPRLDPVQDGDSLTLGGLFAPAPFLLAGSGISKLDPEPQEGPTEYKLHLLLRPRKANNGLLLPSNIVSSQQGIGRTPSTPANSVARLSIRSTPGTPPLQARQKRLEHLTTQLLWRLQQSSPYHSQSTLKLVPPVLPESGPILNPVVNTGKLLPGLEESKGALYEIGVADDGEFVGLTKDEMDESLINLRSMAGSLGCKIELLRTVIVGDYDNDETNGIAAAQTTRSEKLWVVEALVLPNTHYHSSLDAPHSPLEVKRIETIKDDGKMTSTVPTAPLEYADSQTSQLRVSLTGSTTSGKSSLVGTLSTSALDSGRGKTRLSLLKHRHEIESGVTSSVAPELIGYHTITSDHDSIVHVVNYGFGNISSWNDIHNAAEGERLVFLLDSAGHPRYRRTTVRGLVSWAPHWTLCCVAADDYADSVSRSVSADPSTDVLDSAKTSVDMSGVHLELCLKLELPLIVAITKLDIATNAGLRNTLSKVLSIIKAAGRNPVLLKPDSGTRTSEELQTLSSSDIAEVESIFSKGDPKTIVPIVLTSAVKGSGLRKLHALLRFIPVLEDTPTTEPEEHDSVFYIDEVFAKTNIVGDIPAIKIVNILSGHLCYDDLEIGDEVLIGPYTSDTIEPPPLELSRARSYPSRMTIASLHDLSRSAPKTHTLSSIHQDARQKSTSPFDNSKAFPILSIPSSAQQEEWLHARITSIRNLRLPLRRLIAGQVGTIGIELQDSEDSQVTTQKLRKGMVLIKSAPESLPPRACSGLRVTLPASSYLLMEPGALFTLYITSIRTLAKITSVEAPHSPITSHHSATNTSTSVHNANTTTSHANTHNHKNYNNNEDEDTVFLFDDPTSPLPEITYSASGRREVRYQPRLSPDIEVSFSFVAGGREWVRVGSKALVMPTSVPEGASALVAVVGVVAEVFF